MSSVLCGCKHSPRLNSWNFPSSWSTKFRLLVGLLDTCSYINILNTILLYKYKLEIVSCYCIYVTRPLFRRPAIASGTTASAAFEGSFFSWVNAFVDSIFRFGAPCMNGIDKRESWYSRPGFCSRMESNFGRHPSQSVSISSLRNIYFSPLSGCIDWAARKKESYLRNVE